MIPDGRIAIALAVALASDLTPVRAAMYQGLVKESRFGVGIGSVKVTLQSASAATYTASTGRFSFLTSDIPSRARSHPEILWFPRSRTLAWSAVTGPFSLAIADAAGKTVDRFSATAGGTGLYRVRALPPGIYFASAHAMGRTLSWSTSTRAVPLPIARYSPTPTTARRPAIRKSTGPSKS